MYPVKMYSAEKIQQTIQQDKGRSVRACNDCIMEYSKDGLHESL